MQSKFISNDELHKLLLLATDDERMALTKLLDSDEENAYDAKYLQEQICLAGGHGIANIFRGEGTGYLDILDDVADALKIADRQPYDFVVKYFDESPYIKGSEDEDRIRSEHNREDATKLGLEYASETEEKVIVALIKKSYELLIENKDELRTKLSKLQEKKSILISGIEQKSKESDDLRKKLHNQGVIAKLFTSEEKKQAIRKQIEVLEGQLDKSKQRKPKIESEIQGTESELREVTRRIDAFDKTIDEVGKEFDVSHVGALTGTAGIMVLANLGGFATYTFLTSMMSVLSMGTLGFGAYTAATSLLSILIGPVGWAGLGIFAVFSLGKPKMSQLMPIAATIGAIRQRIKYG